jgi:hypothetical protein
MICIIGMTGAIVIGVGVRVLLFEVVCGFCSILCAAVSIFFADIDLCLLQEFSF